jgi:hypothetical protein
VTQPVIQLNPGDTVPLGTILANLHLMGVVTDPSTPNQFGATLEAFGDQGVLAVPVLQGPPGPAGTPQFALKFQNDNLTDPTQLPNNLNDTTDVGKYWIFKSYDNNGNVVGTQAYIWYGSTAGGWRTMPMGSQGPPGPYPVITPTVNLLDPDLTSYIDVTGPSSNPNWALHLAVPAGPAGPAGGWNQFDDTTPPTVGQVIGFAGKYSQSGQPIFQPMNVGDILPRPYTIPESAFTAYNGITQSRQTVCTWQAPAQQWDWQPFVWGQMAMFGVSFLNFLSFGGVGGNAQIVGCEVRLNDPNTGPIVALGVGNATGVVTIIPHTSSSSSPTTAMTPDNNYAKVAAGVQPTLYVNLVNESAGGSFDFKPANAQLAMLALPQATTRALPTTYYGIASARSSFTATHG